MTIKKKRLEKQIDRTEKNSYTKSVGSLACQKKEVHIMTGQQYITIKGSLHEEHGTYIVRARVPDPETGKIRRYFDIIKKSRWKNLPRVRKFTPKIRGALPEVCQLHFLR